MPKTLCEPSASFQPDYLYLTQRCIALRGLKFDSGSLHSRQTGIELYAKTERDIFRLLQLDWVPPEFRNADG